MAHESAYALRIQHVHGLSDTDGVLLSPINIEMDPVINIDLPDLTWYNYDQPAKKMKVTNTSHTVPLIMKITEHLQEETAKSYQHLSWCSHAIGLEKCMLCSRVAGIEFVVRQRVSKPLSVQNGFRKDHSSIQVLFSAAMYFPNFISIGVAGMMKEASTPSRRRDEVTHVNCVEHVDFAQFYDWMPFLMLTVCEEWYPMEMHVVHFKSSYLTQERALREKDGLVVLVYFFKVQEKPSPAMQSIMDVIPQVQKAHTSAHIMPRPISDFVRPFAKNYFMYWGSVMTSSCSHRILWLVSREPIGISSDQMESFRMLKDSSNMPIKHHSRDVQPLQGRSLFLVNGVPHIEEVLLPIPAKPSSVISVLGPGYTKTIGDEPENEIPQEPESKEQDKENNIPFQRITAFYAPNTVIRNPLKQSRSKASQLKSHNFLAQQQQTYLYEDSFITEEPWTISSEATILKPSGISVNDTYTLQNPCQFSQTSSDSSKCFSLHSNIASVRTQTSDDELLDDFTRYSKQREDVGIQVPSAAEVHKKSTKLKRKYAFRRSEHRGLQQRSRSISRVVYASSISGGPHRLQRTSSKKRHSTEYYVWPYKYIRSCANLQIPINIIPRQVPGKRFPPLEIGNLVSSSGYATIANTGESVEIRLHGRSLPLLQGGPLDDIYILNHVHFHWNEEEYSNTELSFESYSVEAHAVYCKQCYKSVEEACEKEKGLVVVAAFLQECELYNWEFDKVSGKLGNIKQPNTSTELLPDALSWMEKLGPNGYFTYPGSRHDRSISSIIWILNPDPISISHSQVEAFYKLHKCETDTEIAVEKLADHPIYYSI